MTSTLFFYGTLRHPPILRAVLGRAADLAPARLRGHQVHWAAGETIPLIVPAEGAVADGVLVEGVDAQERERLDYYEAGFGYRLEEVTVEAAGPRRAEVYMPVPGLRAAGAAWSLADWVAAHGAAALEAAEEYMALWPAVPPDRALALFPQILDRAAARVRARVQARPRGRRGGGPVEAIEVIERSRPHVGFFALEDWRLRVPRFAGGQGDEVRRLGLAIGDAVTVLPYDPVRDRVLLVEQFRFGTMVRGDPLPWTLEPVAGRIDGNEDPEVTARRETQEEAGIVLDRLVPIGRYYTTPGGTSEYLYSYIGLADLPDGMARSGGLEDEDEDLRLHLVPFTDLMAMVDSGEAENGPLLVSALALARCRDGLRG